MSAMNKENGTFVELVNIRQLAASLYEQYC
jgi:hypothetical protein